MLLAEGEKFLELRLLLMKRLAELDILRGALLLMMVVNHSPSALRRFTDQPLGFFTTAEAFVFVSAFLAGLLFRRRSEQRGFAAAQSSTFRRAWRIYRAHLLTLAFAFVIGSFFLNDFPGAENLLNQYLANPLAAILASFALLFRPPLMDILPMYIVFSLLTPLAFWVARRWSWKVVIIVSAVVWSIAQTRTMDLLNLSGKNISYIELGPFDLLAWQLLWISGLFCGQRFQDDRPVLPLPGAIRIAFLLLAIAFLIWRWSSIWTGVDPRTWLFDKWHLGPLRLINFLTTGWVISRFIKHLERWEILLRPLAQIGCHMLPVFCCERAQQSGTSIVLAPTGSS